MSSGVHHGDDNDLLACNTVINTEWKPVNQSALGIAINSRVQGRQLCDPLEGY